MTGLLGNTNPTQTVNEDQSCMFPVYISFNSGMNHSHWSNLTSDGQFTWTTGYDTLITVVTQCGTPITMNVHNLERGVSFGIYRVCRFVYSFTHYQHLILI